LQYKQCLQRQADIDEICAVAMLHRTVEKFIIQMAACADTFLSVCRLNNVIAIE
jgi:hypothetical protein